MSNSNLAKPEKDYNDKSTTPVADDELVQKLLNNDPRLLELQNKSRSNNHYKSIVIAFLIILVFLIAFSYFVTKSLQVNPSSKKTNSSSNQRF